MIGRRELIIGGAAAAPGRLRRARSSASGCGASACSCREWRTIRNTRPATRRSCKGSANWAGSSAATCASTTAGAPAMSSAIARSRRNWSRSSPDVILALGFSTVSALQKATRSVPIVFASVTDPVGGGLVASLARPGGNTTGFIYVRIRLWRKVAGAAQGDRAARDARGGSAGSRRRLADRPVRRHPVGGVVARGRAAPDRHARCRRDRARRRCIRRRAEWRPDRDAGAAGFLHRELIVALAARHRLPAVYAYRSHVMSGGLISYGADRVDQFRRAAGYVDRILKGEKPADLPVQAPTKYELVINLKTAKALGLDVPPTRARPRRRGDRINAGFVAFAHGRLWHDSDDPITTGYVRSLG